MRSAIPLLSDTTVSRVRRTSPQGLTVEIFSPFHSIVKLSFFGTIKFGRLYDPKLTDDLNLIVASPKDIFALKLKTLLQRASHKDYKDIVELLKAGFSLKDGIEGAMAIFGTMFSPAIALRALNYFTDISPPLSENDQNILKKATKAFLIKGDTLKPLIKVSNHLSFLPSKELITTKADFNFMQAFPERLGF